MPHRSRSASILPQEIIDIIVGFAANIAFVELCDTQHYKYPNFSDAAISSSISRKLNESPTSSIFCGEEIACQSYPISYSSTVTLQLPVVCPGSNLYPRETFIFFRELRKRQSFFKPKTFCIRDSYRMMPHLICHEGPVRKQPDHPCLITALSETFSTVTKLDLYTPLISKCCSDIHRIIFSLKELQELDIHYELLDSLAKGVYCMPEGLHALHFNALLHPVGDGLNFVVDWLRLHPSLRQMRYISVNIQPATHPGGVIDLTRHTQLHWLCFQIPKMKDLAWEPVSDSILRTLRTATWLHGSLEIQVDASNFCDERMNWWHSLGKALSLLPQDAVVKLRMVYMDGTKKGNEKDIVKKVFQDAAIHRQVSFRSERHAIWVLGEQDGCFGFPVLDIWKYITVEVE
ncbi:hypothetical protein WG66_011426 [Moniliophthora roreri]|nr:hypothetical protein WG66_011426 [Moniliophthora roreri]